jgi:hypothetical protein
MFNGLRYRGLVRPCQGIQFEGRAGARLFRDPVDGGQGTFYVCPHEDSKTIVSLATALTVRTGTWFRGIRFIVSLRRSE